MDFCRTIIHVVQPGDTFYRLAQRYQTTVPDIILRNPGVNPYNLQIGTRLRICAGRMEDSLQKDEMDLSNDMREAWYQHGFWTTLYLLSMSYALPNAGSVQERLMETADDIAEIFGKFYSQKMVEQLKALLMEHIELAGQLMEALRDQKTGEAEQIEAKWRQNADQIARMLSSANSEYRYEDLQQLFNMHLDTLKQQMIADNNNNYEAFVKATDENTQHLMQIADALTAGLIRQFYQKQQ
ncbi:MAG: LysM peptidoglycan-binding domain-containing protein [Lachnospiraceae bacterium]|nr:LysM peptidoglycan-binding domain-containing protein [Lachnospiraceae bacterium]